MNEQNAAIEQCENWYKEMLKLLEEPSTEQDYVIPVGREMYGEWSNMMSKKWMDYLITGQCSVSNDEVMKAYQGATIPEGEYKVSQKDFYDKYWKKGEPPVEPVKKKEKPHPEFGG